MSFLDESEAQISKQRPRLAYRFEVERAVSLEIDAFWRARRHFPLSILSKWVSVEKFEIADARMCVLLRF